MSSGEQELQELEARLREAEQRLARVSRHNSPSRPADSGANNKQAAGESARAHPLAQKPSFPADRPPTSDETTLPLRDNRQTMMTGMAGAPQQVSAGSEYARSQRGYG